MADQLQVAAAVAGGGAGAEAGVGAGAGAAAGGDAGAGAGRRRAPAATRICTTHQLPWLKNNPNHQKPMKGRSKKDKDEEDADIQLNARFIVADEIVNLENEKLVDIYNDLFDIGKQYSKMVGFLGKGQFHEMDRLKVNFVEVCRKVKRQEAAVRQVGGEPMPVPGSLFRRLPNVLKRIMKDTK